MAASTIGPKYDALIPKQKARIAFMRFGLGPKAGGPAALSSSPGAALQALLAEVSGPAPLIADSALVYDGPRLSYVPQGSPLTLATCCLIGANNTGDENAAVLSAERGARLAKHMEPTVGFVEQLVIFWSNHFSINSNKGPLVKASVGNMERVAIRPNVLGKFSDMLRAVITHPAMIKYLDNDKSYGQASVWAAKQKKAGHIVEGDITYNENLGREILELHTLGINYNYSQQPYYTQSDVTSLAKVITGWTVSGNLSDAPTTSGQFSFNADMHEPNPQSVVGNTFAQTGQGQGLAVLDMLAAHPATASHIARKLLQHFVCDEPDASDIASLANVFMTSGGNLRAVANALVRMEVAWSTDLDRMRQPYPWMVSVFRGLGVSSATLDHFEGTFQNLLTLMNQGIWGHITPEGFADDNYVWETPNTVRLQKDAAGALMSKKGVLDSVKVTPTKLAEGLLSEGVPDSVSAALSSFKDERQAISMLFVTPEFMRR